MTTEWVYALARGGLVASVGRDRYGAWAVEVRQAGRVVAMWRCVTASEARYQAGPAIQYCRDVSEGRVASMLFWDESFATVWRSRY